ncbi:hypothetical protein [Nonomuraea rhizosphaerae]|uniref:hypothetical protein n=1 Tax=Nonomuraea rhizosphaerae TaxID=2665663 RepID=UPI001C5D0E5C|nr:hypothetical protein [Nonomuraea rhizosphaerae]
MAAEAGRKFWQGPDGFARRQGWEIVKRGWGGRRYRDPRFDLPRKEATAPPERLVSGDGFPRNHPRIPKANDLIAMIGMVWRWRVEIAGAFAAPFAVVPLVGWLGPLSVFLLATALGLVCGGIAPVRRLAAAPLGRLVTRHRFQGLCLRTSLRTPKGRLPLVLQTASVTRGTVLLIWCRSGMSVELFEDYVPEMKVACFAKEVSVFPHYRWAHLLTIELMRA